MLLFFICICLDFTVVFASSLMISLACFYPALYLQCVMALNGLVCADVLLRNYLLTIDTHFFVTCSVCLSCRAPCLNLLTDLNAVWQVQLPMTHSLGEAEILGVKLPAEATHLLFIQISP